MLPAGVPRGRGNGRDRRLVEIRLRRRGGIDTYGEVGPAPVLFKHFGFTEENVADGTGGAPAPAVIAEHSEPAHEQPTSIFDADSATRLENARHPYPVVSLFSGAMGLDLGLNEAGLRVAVSQDMDKWCIETMRRNSHLAIDGDIRDLIESDPSCEFFLQASGVTREALFAVVGGPLPTLLHGRQTQGWRTHAASYTRVHQGRFCPAPAILHHGERQRAGVHALRPADKQSSLCWTPS